MIQRLGGSALGALVGRDTERRQLGQFAASLSQHPEAMVVSGEAGIGKTALWRECVAHCRRAGYRVLVTLGAEEEMSGALVALHDLFEDTGFDPTSLSAATDSAERGRSVLATIRDLAAEGPLLIAIDDVQWIDALSAQLLRFALRRLHTEPVGVLVTCRRREQANDRLGLSRSWPPEQIETIEVGPLGDEDLRRVLGQVISSISPIAFGHIARLSGGNPLYAIELARAVAPEETYDSAASIQLPTSLDDAIEIRLESAPQDLMPLLEVISATGPSPISRLQRYLPSADVDELITEGEELGYVTVEEGPRVRLAHPLLASAVYGRIDPMTRRSLHAQLGDKETDHEIKNWHLALSTDGPSGEIAARMERSADDAMRREAPDMAAFFARHSRRLTPPDDTTGARRRALLEATSLAAAGEASRARALIDQIVLDLPPGLERAEALMQRFYVENDDIETGDATLVQALEDAAGDSVQTGRVLDILGWHRGVFRGDLRAGIATAGEAVAIAEDTGDTNLWMLAASHLAHMEAMAGRPRLDVMHRAVEVGRKLGAPALGGGPEAWLGKQQLWAGELDAAEDTLTRVARVANRLEIPYRLYDLALLACARGRFDEAREQTGRGIEAAQDSDNLDAEGWLLYPLALVHGWTGEVPEARTAARRLAEWPGRPGNQFGRLRALSALGLIALSEGDNERAISELGAALAVAEIVGLAHPGAIPVLPDAVIAYAAVGDLQSAKRYLEQLGREASELGHERTWALFHFAYGTTLLADGEADSAAEALAESAATHERLGLIPDAARIRLVLGQALVRSGQRNQAQRELAAALDAFEAMGARLWKDRAAIEMQRADPRPGQGGALTTTEARIAILVSEGRRNREISNDLFISVATVEAHLTRIYRKLGIRSRAELTRLVSDGTLDLGESRDDNDPSQ